MGDYSTPVPSAIPGKENITPSLLGLADAASKGHSGQLELACGR